MTWKYLGVEQPNKLVYTCAMPDFSPIIDTITVEIQSDGKGGSQTTFTQVGEGIDEELQQLPEGTVSESEKGWKLGFDLMVEHWKKVRNEKQTA
ncbi:MAG TPA: SRPBCC domain-containing protein [Ignavibacteriaceae bacterium]|nr:SRPBCC domain-containing protein [Ignavibacteriaceae bacterium]